MKGPHLYIIKYKDKCYKGRAAQKAARLLLRYPNRCGHCSIKVYILKS